MWTNNNYDTRPVTFEVRYFRGSYRWSWKEDFVSFDISMGDQGFGTINSQQVTIKKKKESDTCESCSSSEHTVAFYRTESFIFLQTHPCDDRPPFGVECSLTDGVGTNFSTYSNLPYYVLWFSRWCLKVFIYYRSYTLIPIYTQRIHSLQHSFCLLVKTFVPIHLPVPYKIFLKIIQLSMCSGLCSFPRPI